MGGVLFVCTGNICRSPAAEGVFRARAAHLEPAVSADSCGLHGYHTGEAPDRRGRREARRRGFDIEGLRARPLAAEDFRRFDLILAMDRGHLSHLQRHAPAGGTGQVRLFMSFTDRPTAEVPDPYYGTDDDFVRMFDMVEAGVESLIAHLSGR